MAAKTAVMDCECCPDAVNVKCSEYHGMMVCSDCLTKQQNVSTQIDTAKQVDARIEVKSDIFTAEVVSIMEMRAMILADASIPDSQKEYQNAQMSMERWQHYQKVIFDARQTILEAEKFAKAYQSNMLKVVGTLPMEQREKFKSVDISYQPTTPKSVKPKAVKVGSKSSSNNNSASARAELNAAATKYGLNPAMIQLMILQYHCNADEAGRRMIESRTQSAASK